MHKVLSKGAGDMTVYGYARVSTDGQSLASQDAELHAASCAKVYAEKISGARSNRPELAKVLKRLDTGDVSGSHAERPVQGSRRQEYWAADAGGPRAQQAGKLETWALFAGSQGGTVARAGGNTCAPLSAHVG